MRLNNIFTATVESVGAEGVTLILPGQTQPTQKGAKRLASASVAAGDMVLCTRDSGTIVVLGKIVEVPHSLVCQQPVQFLIKSFFIVFRHGQNAPVHLIGQVFIIRLSSFKTPSSL
jgi:hypothetical protein